MTAGSAYLHFLRLRFISSLVKRYRESASSHFFCCFSFFFFLFFYQSISLEISVLYFNCMHLKKELCCKSIMLISSRAPLMPARLTEFFFAPDHSIILLSPCICSTTPPIHTPTCLPGADVVRCAGLVLQLPPH